MDESLDKLEDDYDKIMRERALASDDEFNEDSERSPHRDRRRSRRSQKLEPEGSFESSQPVRSSPPAESSQASLKAPSEPIRYVVDRGLDLPPGAEYPNLFQGASTSWRDYNADAIGPSTAMITERSRDLAAHLYNAHAIRRRTRDSMRNGNSNEKSVFAVPRRWTAWPVPVAQVPRLNEFIHTHMEETGFMHQEPDTRPSADLEEVITAVMTKISKDKYQAREWDYEDVKSDLEKIIGDKEDIMAEELELKEYGRPMVTTSLRPLVQANDDKATNQLRPLARNVITRVDKLLYGLHCAMKGRKFEEESGAEQSSEEDEDDSQSPRKDNEESMTRPRGRTLARKGSLHQQSHSRSASPNPTQAPDVSRTRGGSRDSNDSQDQNHYVKGRLRLRDWSEVMGLASMMDLPLTAVMRASKRCADLFGEDMEFHTLSEGRVKKKLNNDDQWVYTYTESETDVESAPPTPEPRSQPPPKPRSNTRSRSKATAKTPKKRAARKVKTPAIVPPSTSRSPVPEPMADSAEPSPVPGPKKAKRLQGKGEHRKTDLVCPLEDCRRHEMGFSRTWNLNQHMKIAHPSYIASVENRSNRRAKTPGKDDMIEVD